MLKKNKKFTLLLSGLSGALLVSSAAGVALSSCSTTSTDSSSSDVQYSYVIDWNNEDAVKRLNIDSNGLVYSDSAMTTLIAVSPKVKLTTVKIPSRVKSIMGYSKVMYKDSTNGTLYDQIPSGGTASNYIKVYQSYGAFQGMESLETVALESGSQLQSIGGAAFYGCTTLKNISNLSNNLKYVGTSAFNGCTSLEAIDLSNVVKVDDYAFSGCTSLSTIDLSNALSIGNYAFQNCSGLTALGSLDKASSIGEAAFYGATKSGSNISLKFSNLKVMSKSAFYSAKGITTVDFSNNTLLTSINDNAFMYSSATSANFDGCSSLVMIGERTFEGCTGLTSVTLPSNDITSLATIGYNAFINCSNLSTVGVKGTAAKTFIATKKLSTIGANFLANTLVETVDLSSFVISSKNASTNPFGSVASLAYITNLSSVTLPNNITTLNAGLFYGSGLNSTTGFSLKLPSTITSLVYSDSVSIANPNNSNTTTPVTINNVTPFTNSGLASIDMSDITSYQSSSSNATVIPNYLFKDATKLKSVVLKTDTTVIGDYAFQNTTALTSITYPSSPSDVVTVADTVNGFTASNTLTKIGTSAFENAFSDDSAATVDLTNVPAAIGQAAFRGSKVAIVKLYANTTTIPASSFDNMTKLTSINFDALTKLASIVAPNFNNTLLKNIDLSKAPSNLSFQNVNTSNKKLFTGLPVDCVVSLPSTIGNFSDVFKDINNAYVTFNYPNGISNGNKGLVTIDNNGVMSFAASNAALLTNASTLNLSSLSSLKSIGTNTFFGSSKLSSLTLPASTITFAAGTSTTANTAGNTTITNQYVTTNIPFGNNVAFKTLNYTGFTAASSVSTVATDTAAQTTLFNTTNNTTWTEIAKIINSLSYQAYPTSGTEAGKLKANMSEWTNGTTTNGDAINTDTASTFNSGVSVELSNSYSTTSDTTGKVTIKTTDSTATIIHNGVTWTYKNDGSTITLTGKVNMYKASNTNKSYLVFFDQTTYSVTDTPNTVYYVPSQTPVNVTLTIATKASSN